MTAPPSGHHLPKLGLELGPKASEATLSTELAGFTDTVECKTGDFKGANLVDPLHEAGLACGTAGGTRTGDKTTQGDNVGVADCFLAYGDDL